MKLESQKILYKLCLIITGTSAVNLSMSSYFIKQLLKKRFQRFNQLQTVEQMLQIPQIKTLSNTKKSQINRAIGKFKTNVAFFNGKAYWVKDNQFYCSKIKEDGDLDIEGAQKIDAFNLSEKDMKHVLKILDSLSGM